MKIILKLLLVTTFCVASIYASEKTEPAADATVATASGSKPGILLSRAEAENGDTVTEKGLVAASSKYCSSS